MPRNRDGEGFFDSPKYEGKFFIFLARSLKEDDYLPELDQAVLRQNKSIQDIVIISPDLGALVWKDWYMGDSEDPATANTEFHEFAATTYTEKLGWRDPENAQLTVTFDPKENKYQVCTIQTKEEAEEINNDSKQFAAEERAEALEQLLSSLTEEEKRCAIEIPEHLNSGHDLSPIIDKETEGYLEKIIFYSLKTGILKYKNTKQHELDKNLSTYTYQNNDKPSIEIGILLNKAQKKHRRITIQVIKT